jgi:hypothetical protein
LINQSVSSVREASAQSLGNFLPRLFIARARGKHELSELSGTKKEPHKTSPFAVNNELLKTRKI